VSQKLSPIEQIKTSSQGLRGSLAESLGDELTGAVRETDHALIKFHGMYEQDDRDLREERAAQKLDKLYSFMVRLRIPGGAISAAQWVAAHHIAGAHSTGVIKITTRQTIQLHGILKSDIKPTLQQFDKAGLDSIAACGDVNRNVACASFAPQIPAHEEVQTYADKISRLLLPKTRAYYEVWLDEEKLAEHDETDPLYQDRYLPRKFKIGIAIPPNNDVDVLTNDLGLIAIIENDTLTGFNIAVGGGLSTTYGNAATYARLATVIGFVSGEAQILKAVYEVLTIQRDFGNRSDRKLARLKYTLDNMGVGAFTAELEKRCGFALQPVQPYHFNQRQDHFGWQQDYHGRWYYTLFVENGRVADTDTLPLKSALLAIAESGLCSFRFTSNQNIILSEVAEADKPAVEMLLQQFGILAQQQTLSGLRKNSMACVALPTCPLALAEAQRYLPQLIDKVEDLLQQHGLSQNDIILRMTGCPNGCARPYAAEIGFTGTGPGEYNLYLGGDREGQRLNILYREKLQETAILAILDELLGQYQQQRTTEESFGDFAIRQQWVTA
jgi:sulfite reductase (NADPH) hemoprotein beta-component